jgi:hypothetical protein
MLEESEELESAPFDANTVDFGSFEPDISPHDWAEKYRSGALSPFFYFRPIDLLSPVKTVGRGRTNLTLIMATIVQTDAATPYAGFDMRATPSRRPAVSMHVEPSAYGIAATGTYVMSFAIETSGPVTFSLSGYAAGGTLSGAGAKTVNGQQTVSLVFNNVPASAQFYGTLEQTGGGVWSWYRTSINYPPLVLQL